MRAAISLLVLLAVGLLPRETSARSAPAQLPEEAKPFRSIRCFTPERVLPAITHLDSFYEWTYASKLPHALPCPRPRAAVIAGAFVDETQAQRAVAELRGRELPFGYPVVVAPLDLWLDLPVRRVAVVVGLFQRREDADAWQRTHPGFTQVRVLRSANDGRADPWRVIRLSASGPVPAYSERQAVRLSHRDAGTFPPSRRVPICHAPAHGLFALPTKQFDDAIDGKEGEHVDRDGINLIPIRCGTKLSYVDRLATTYQAVFWTDRAGTRRITQITGHGCGFTMFATAVVDPSGQRTVKYETPLVYDGC
jgi:hypothetical protein